MCSIQEQSSTICSNKEQFYDGSSKKEQSKQDKNCQADQSTHMQLVMPAMDMWSNRPTV